MFNTFIKYNRDLWDKSSDADRASMLQSLLQNARVQKDPYGRLFVNDGEFIFDVRKSEYVDVQETLQDVSLENPHVSCAVGAVPMQKARFRVGKRLVTPIYDFRKRTLSFIGVPYTSDGKTVTIQDGAHYHKYAYGLNGSIFYFKNIV